MNAKEALALSEGSTSTFLQDETQHVLSKIMEKIKRSASLGNKHVVTELSNPQKLSALEDVNFINSALVNKLTSLGYRVASEPNSTAVKIIWDHAS